MKKSTKRSTKKVTKATRAVKTKRMDKCVDCGFADCQCPPNSMWGKDQGMILMLSAGTIILIVVGMYFMGWL
jgi:hypothetical protein